MERNRRSFMSWPAARFYPTVVQPSPARTWNHIPLLPAHTPPATNAGPFYMQSQAAPSPVPMATYCTPVPWSGATVGVQTVGHSAAVQLACSMGAPAAVQQKQARVAAPSAKKNEAERDYSVQQLRSWVVALLEKKSGHAGRDSGSELSTDACHFRLPRHLKPPCHLMWSVGVVRATCGSRVI